MQTTPRDPLPSNSKETLSSPVHRLQLPFLSIFLSPLPRAIRPNGPFFLCILQCNRLSPVEITHGDNTENNMYLSLKQAWPQTVFTYLHPVLPLSNLYGRNIPVYQRLRNIT
jgi:hypothetical protein